jgi:glutamate-1-semialdehyde 2,1-aminomutase
VKAGSGVMNLNSTSSSAGIPDSIVQNTVSLTYNDTEGVRTFIRNNGSSLAAVILEPIAGNIGVVPATHEFITMLREETKKTGTLLIFDEVITGFRVGEQGAQSIYPVKPDLTCFGKIIGGGFPAAAFGGRAEIMDYLAPLGPVYQAGTLSGNPVAMEAGYQALTRITPTTYSELAQKTAIITDPVKECIAKHSLNACIQQCGSMFTLFFGKTAVLDMNDAQATDRDRFKNFFCYMHEHGVYIPPLQQEAWFISTVHTEEHLDKTRDLILKYLTI